MQVLPQWFIFLPEPNQTAASKPSGYHMTCRGVARQGEDGRTHLVRQVRQVRQVRLKRHANATRIPPQPSSKPSTTLRQLCPRAKPHNGKQTLGVILCTQVLHSRCVLPNRCGYQKFVFTYPISHTLHQCRCLIFSEHCVKIIIFSTDQG